MRVAIIDRTRPSTDASPRPGPGRVPYPDRFDWATVDLRAERSDGDRGLLARTTAETGFEGSGAGTPAAGARRRDRRRWARVRRRQRARLRKDVRNRTSAGRGSECSGSGFVASGGGLPAVPPGPHFEHGPRREDRVLGRRRREILPDAPRRDTDDRFAFPLRRPGARPAHTTLRLIR